MHLINNWPWLKVSKINERKVKRQRCTSGDFSALHCRRCSALLAICQESFMKKNYALWNLLGKRQGKENLLRNSLMN
jgi:hypothetical protein